MLPEESGVRYLFNEGSKRFEIAPDIQGQVKIEGLEAGEVLEVTVTDSAWTEVIVVVPADKETIALNIQNPDVANIVKLDYQNIVVKGMNIYPNGGERQYVVKKSLSYYLRAVSGSVTLNIEVLN